MIDRPCGHSDPRSCDLACRVEALEQIIHPEGRCVVCGGGKPYWKHGGVLAPTLDTQMTTLLGALDRRNIHSAGDMDMYDAKAHRDAKP